MTRKIALIVAALIIPGGLIALGLAWFVRLLSQNERARKVCSNARQWVAPAALVRREAA